MKICYTCSSHVFKVLKARKVTKNALNKEHYRYPRLCAELMEETRSKLCALLSNTTERLPSPTPRIVCSVNRSNTQLPTQPTPHTYIHTHTHTYIYLILHTISLGVPSPHLRNFIKSSDKDSAQHQNSYLL